MTETAAITYRSVTGMTADDVAFKLERLGESDLWAATVHYRSDAWTSTVNGRDEAEAAVLVLAARVTAIRQAQDRLTEAYDLAAQRSRTLTDDARKARGEVDDEPPF